MVAPVHPALIVDTVPDAEHVPDLVGHDLAGTEEHQILCLLGSGHLIPVEFWRISIEAKNACLGHDIG